jgi:DNA-binding MarR family transcriptional regulator
MVPYNQPPASTLAREIELNRAYESQDEVLLLSLLRTHHLLERTSALFFARFDLTVTQFNALMIVRDWQADGVKASELARRIVINRASAGALVDGLCDKGLIERREVPEDRRAYHLHLTELGRATLERVLPEYYAMMANGLGRFTDKRKDTAIRFLAELRAVLHEEIESRMRQDATR